MKSSRRAIFFILLNILISACVTLAVITIWGQTKLPSAQENLALTVAAVETSSAKSIALATQSVLSTPTPDQASSPEEQYEAYLVEFGDTLGLIAEKFDVSVDAIMEVNQLNDPNSLAVGAVLYIPSSDAQNARPSATQQPTAIQQIEVLDTPLAVENQVNITGVIGVGDIENEHVFLTRTGTGNLSLAGWRLQDDEGNVFIFPQLEFYTRRGVNVWTRVGASTPADLYWGMIEPVWRPGETVSLYDPQGSLRASYVIP